MSDFKAVIRADFINRRKGKRITSVPVQNRITVNKDIRSLTDSFDFEISFRFGEEIELHSHDFVEFYFYLPNTKTKFQISCGYIEDFVKETNSSALKFQANGRDFLGQFFSLPFLKAKTFNQTSTLNFLTEVIKQEYKTDGQKQDTYLAEYLRFNNRTQLVLDHGASKTPLNIQNLSDAKIAPVVQQSYEEVMNIVYQHRKGSVVVWGRGEEPDLKFLNANKMGYTLSEDTDQNVKRFVLRENYSKVFSEVKIQYAGGENNIDYYSTPSNAVFNSNRKARQIFQPEIRTFQTDTLVTTGGTIGVDQKRDALAKSILRKSNQNLTQVVIQTHRPFYLTKTGDTIPYEVNQLWKIYSYTNEINEYMRLVGIGYTQDANELNVELCFIPMDSLI
jgi:hypothetical protein